MKIPQHFQSVRIKSHEYLLRMSFCSKIQKQYFNYSENGSGEFTFIFKSNVDSSSLSICSNIIARVSFVNVFCSKVQKKTIDDCFDKRGFPEDVQSIIMEYVEHVEVLFDCNNVIKGT